MQLVQQQQVASRRLGGMLNYIQTLRGVCPEGYEMQYFKQGGKTCKKCVQKAKMMEDGRKTPDNPIDAFRCGRKMKKKACGGTVKEAKYGTKVEMDKCGKKMKKKACGNSVKKGQTGASLPTAEPANQRYEGGTYRGPSRPVLYTTLGMEEPPSFSQTEYIIGPRQTFTSPATMTLEYNPALGDSTITEVPTHFQNITNSWLYPNSVKVRPRTATNKGDNPQEWETMKKRWEQAKKVTR